MEKPKCKICGGRHWSSEGCGAGEAKTYGDILPKLMGHLVKASDVRGPKLEVLEYVEPKDRHLYDQIDVQPNRNNPLGIGFVPKNPSIAPRSGTSVKGPVPGDGLLVDGFVISDEPGASITGPMASDGITSIDWSDCPHCAERRARDAKRAARHRAKKLGRPVEEGE